MPSNQLGHVSLTVMFVIFFFFFRDTFWRGKRDPEVSSNNIVHCTSNTDGVLKVSFSFL